MVQPRTSRFKSDIRIKPEKARKREPEVPNWGPTFIKAAGHH